MRGYVIGLFGLAVCCALVELFSPEGEGGGISRHVKMLSGVCLLLVLWTPLSALMRGGGDLSGRLANAIENWLREGEEQQEDFSQIWQGEQERLDLMYASEMIKELLIDQFEISGEDISVQVETDEAGERISLVCVALRGQAIWLDTHKMQSYLNEILQCESTIYLE